MKTTAKVSNQSLTFCLLGNIYLGGYDIVLQFFDRFHLFSLLLLLNLYSTSTSESETV